MLSTPLRRPSRHAVVLLGVIALLAGCGTGTKPETVTNSSARESSAAVMFGAVVPEKPDSNPVMSADINQYQGVVTGPGVFAVLQDAKSSDRGYVLQGLDASTGKEIWARTTTNNLVLASDNEGPGVGRAGTIVYAEYVDMPQEGTTPARTRTDIVAINASNGKGEGDQPQLWRFDALRTSVDEQNPDQVLKVQTNTSTTMVLTPTRLTALDTRSGTEKWHKDIDRSSKPTPTPTDGVGTSEQEPARFLNAGMGDSTVVVTAQTTDTTGYVMAFDEFTGAARWPQPVATATESQRSGMSSGEDGDSSGQVVVTGGRALIGQKVLTQTETGGSSSSGRIVGLSLTDGSEKVNVKTSEQSYSSTVPQFSVDEGTGTLIYTNETQLMTYAISDGSPRKSLTLAVKPVQVQGKAKLIFATLTSGTNTDLAIIRTQSLEQVSSFSIGEVKGVRIFAGAIATADDKELHVYR